MTDEASGYETRFDYRVDILARNNRVHVLAGDTVLAESTRTLLIDEQDHGLVFYIPFDDARMDALRPIEHTTRCPYKGNASHYALRDGDDTPIAWTYKTPYPEVARIVDHIAFYQDRVTVTVGQGRYTGPR